MATDWIVPHWQTPPGIRALSTLRTGGTSTGAYESWNLAGHVGDQETAVTANRERLRQVLPGEPAWLTQVHGTGVVDAANGPAEGDASFTTEAGVVCAVLTADCLPLLLCSRDGSRVAAAHAGWRGLAAGVIEATVDALGVPGDQLVAWLGPAIGPDAFEVGEEVRDTFVAHDPAAVDAFRPGEGGRWFADLYTLARQRLARRGVAAAYGGGLCTFADRERFFSFRRDGTTGRMATLIWRSA